MAQQAMEGVAEAMRAQLEEILRCRSCGFRIRGYPAHYLSARAVRCPVCRGGTPLSLEDRVRLTRLAAARREGVAVSEG